jgi:hypothetical protein
VNLPPSFAKVSGQAATLSAPTENKQANGKNKGGSKDRKGQKKQKSDDGNGNIVKNTTQPVEFKLTTRESWKTTLQQFYHMINLRGWTKFRCAQGGTEKKIVLTTAQERSAT